MLTTPAMAAVTDDRAWVRAMVDVEIALATVEEEEGLIPGGIAAALAGIGDGLDVAAIGRAAVESGTPVVPLLAEISAALPADISGWVHWGATSQDVVDTAMMLVVRRGLDLIAADLHHVAGAAAALAERHRRTLMSGRTVMQPAVPITFGLKAAGWLTAASSARREIVDARHHRLAVQFGGAAGTLASLGPAGVDVMRSLAEALELAEPVMPWHASRSRIVAVAAAMGIAGGAMAKIAGDVILLMQAEVGEVAEPAGPGRGGSSTMAHKRNPVLSVAVDAAFRRSQPLVATLLASMVQEHERAAGAWQAEWGAMRDLLRFTAGAVARTAEILAGLEVDADRMRTNLERALGSAPPELGSADAFIDRALADYRRV
jgi:3-carboxy-cis,cis-muconate cycloisomerase